MSRRTVLLLEDNDAAQYIFGTALRHAGYDVISARTAAEGLRLLAEGLADAVVVDIGLPDVDGFEVIRRIRQAPSTAALPVVVATVHVFPADEEEARLAGCNVFLKKPLAPFTLVGELNRLLGPVEEPTV